MAGSDWVVTCQRPSRKLEPPQIQLLIETELTRVPAKEQAMRKAIDQLKDMGIRNPEVVSASPYVARHVPEPE